MEQWHSHSPGEAAPAPASPSLSRLTSQQRKTTLEPRERGKGQSAAGCALGSGVRSQGQGRTGQRGTGGVRALELLEV